MRTRARQKYDGSGSDDPPLVSGPAPRHTHPPNTEIEADIYTAQGNINFFKDVEEGRQAGTATNKEHEAEKKAEQEKYEKSIGYLTYLGQDSVEAGGGRAWYELESGRVVRRDNDSDSKNCSDIGEVGLKSKSKMDPIHDIIKYGGFKTAIKDTPTPKCVSTASTTIVKEKTEVKKSDSTLHNIHNLQKAELKATKHPKKHKKDRKKRRKEKKKLHKRKHKSNSNNNESTEEESKHSSSDRQACMKRKRRDYDSSEEEDERQHKKKRKVSKQKKSKDKKRRSYSSSSTSSDSSNYSSLAYSSEDEAAAQEKKKKLEKLREERLKREAEERRRAERLLAGKEPDNGENKVKKPLFVQKYNSQYNPHIARQNQEPTTLQAGVKYWL